MSLMPTKEDKAYSKGLGQGFRMAEKAKEAAKKDLAQRKAALLEAVRGKQAEWVALATNCNETGMEHDAKCGACLLDCADELDAVLAKIEELL
jgi:hypothetical protein